MGGIEKMKNLIAVVITIAILVFPCTVKAETQTVVLDGDIKPVREFYLGEYAEHLDFEASGNIIETETNEIIPLSDWKIYAYESVKENYVDVIIKYLPDMDKDIPRYGDISGRVDVVTKDYSPNLKRQVPSTIHTIETDLSKIFNKYDFVFRNSAGKIIPGELQHDNVQLGEGVNLVSYEFKPYKELITDYGYETYNIHSGTIKIIIR